MSTQRRASRTEQIEGAERKARVEQTGSAFGTRFGRAIASGTTAPFMSILWLAWTWLFGGGANTPPGTPEGMATNSLPSDYRFRKFARLSNQRTLQQTALDRAGGSGTPAIMAKHWSSSLHIPQLPACTRVYSTLPHAPAGQSRWAERHDGEGNLHIQHAA